MDLQTQEEIRRAEFQHLANTVRRKAAAAVRKDEKLLDNLASDIERHGDPEIWKRFGDLLLASPRAQRRDGVVIVTDYFDEGTPLLEIPIDAALSASEAAEDYFRRYAKARNARKIVAQRIAEIETKLANSLKTLEKIDAAIAAEDTEFLAAQLPPPPKPIAVTRKKKRDTEFKGARRFMSSDGIEILVGKKAVDNDFLTFRVAKSMDTWLHAADYPGSHVVIRSAGRKSLPDSTVLQAAQLAAFYSDARDQTKAAVNYTLKKFVNKPKRSAPGLVSLSSFRTLMVEPKVSGDVTLS